MNETKNKDVITACDKCYKKLNHFSMKVWYWKDNLKWQHLSWDPLKMKKANQVTSKRKAERPRESYMTKSWMRKELGVIKVMARDQYIWSREHARVVVKDRSRGQEKHILIARRKEFLLSSNCDQRELCALLDRSLELHVSILVLPLINWKSSFNFSSWVTLATLQVPHHLMWLVASMLVGANIKYFHHCRMFYWTMVQMGPS